jgi:hypothetical protein
MAWVCSWQSLCKLLEFLPAGRAENCQWEGGRGARDSSFFWTNTPNC